MSTTYEVRLPSEIISVIISYVPRDMDRTYTLWSCCSLSHDWYRAAVGLLYESPLLNNKNFDKFARTICPPVNSHIRHTGLGSLIHRLDMGNLAYESTKSLTARMLRRTRVNLEVFVAPAVSFSIPCLAPLSKCTNLRVLDLSRDFYVLELAQLLKSIRKLPIEYLNLPRSAMQRERQSRSWDLAVAQWPVSLRHLGITEWLPPSVRYWEELFESLPDTLTSMALEECFGWHYFWELCLKDVTAKSIRHLRVSIRTEPEPFPISGLLKIFPNVVSLSLPAPIPASELPEVPDVVLPKDQDSNLEALVFHRLPRLVRFSPFIPMEYLLDLVREHAKLTRVTIPEAYLQLEADDSASTVEEIEGLLAQRAGDTIDSGLFMS